MMISTRGRYALRVLIDLAEQERSAYVPLKEIAAQQGLSQKYLESIMGALSKGGLVEGVHGKGGGYRLNRPPEDCSVGEILRLTEGDHIVSAACLGTGADACERAGDCKAFPVWDKLNTLINDYLDSVTLRDLIT